MFGMLGRRTSQSRSISAQCYTADEVFMSLVKERFLEIGFFAEEDEVSAEIASGNVSEFPASVGAEEKRGWGALFIIKRLFSEQESCFDKLVADQ